MTLQTVTPAIPQRWITSAHTLNDFPESRNLAVQWACCEEDVRQAQRLRYRVFATEMGAKLLPPTGRMPGIDIDAFDPFCDHLLVRAVSHRDDDDGQLVGTYRVLAPDAARRAGGLYIDTEFDLTPLFGLRARAVELGRFCVHPSWRSGGVIVALWSALCSYMQVHRLETMIGCASVGLNDGGRSAAALWSRLRATHLVEPRWQVQPRIALPLASDGGPAAAGEAGRMTSIPPLIKGYLRCGARLLGPPALDNAFNTADLPMMLHLSELAPRYRKHFLGD